MATSQLSEFLQIIRRTSARHEEATRTDAQLLDAYVRSREEAAFAALVHRHGPMVWGVCRRVLGHEGDAEDAFQATFLTFARKAGSIISRGSIAAWLYKVAYRIALAAKARTRKIATREKPGSDILVAAPVPDSAWAELRPILDEEVNRLSERLRRPFVLCYLEGQTNEEAAQLLRCPAGTIFSRLARGRAMLRQRLQRRGVTLSLGALTAALATHATEAMPAAVLMASTVRSALLFAAGQTVGDVSAQAASLAEGV